MGAIEQAAYEIMILWLGHNYCQFIIWNKGEGNSRFYRKGYAVGEKGLLEADSGGNANSTEITKPLRFCRGFVLYGGTRSRTGRLIHVFKKFFIYGNCVLSLRVPFSMAGMVRSF